MNVCLWKIECTCSTCEQERNRMGFSAFEVKGK